MDNIIVEEDDELGLDFERSKPSMLLKSMTMMNSGNTGGKTSNESQLHGVPDSRIASYVILPKFLMSNFVFATVKEPPIKKITFLGDKDRRSNSIQINNTRMY